VNYLVVGRSGQVAQALIWRAGQLGLNLDAIGRPEIDLESPDGVIAAIMARSPNVVINAAAYTFVDQAEAEPERAHRVNGRGAQAVARGARAAGAALIHFSTDYVFGGDKPSPYLETDQLGPLSAYGRSKLEGEVLTLEANPRAVVIRTAWVYDAVHSNFVRTMLRLAKSRPHIDVVADQCGCPTYAGDLAEGALSVAAAQADRRAPSGVYHCVGQGETTWAGFAMEIFALAKARGGPSAEVRPIATAGFPTRARRPANSRLDCTKLATDYGVTLRAWREALATCMDGIAANGWRLE
jgi:dTDP-4-dehydrorhamnose reductase